MLIELEKECTWPEEYRLAILNHATQPKSAVGGDPRLQKVILSLDSDSAFTLLADINIGTVFFFKGRQFQKLEKKRTRALVKEIASQKQFTIPLVAQVEPA